jgi:hypothetical protein
MLLLLLYKVSLIIFGCHQVFGLLLFVCCCCLLFVVVCLFIVVVGRKLVANHVCVVRVRYITLLDGLRLRVADGE